MQDLFKGMLEKVKAQYFPVRDPELGICINNGAIAKLEKSSTPNGSKTYRAYVQGKVITGIPEALVLKAPVFTMQKPVSALVPGDIIRTSTESGKTGIYRVVKSITPDGKIVTDSFGGAAESKIKPTTDFLLGLETVTVVLNLLNSNTLTGGFMQNPLMLALLDDKSSDEDTLSNIMMLNYFTQQGGINAQGNPMANMMPLLLFGGDKFNLGENSDLMKMAMVSSCMSGGNAGGMQMNNLLPLMFLGGKGGDSSTKDLLMFSMFANNGGANPFGGLFGQQANPMFQTSAAPVAQQADAASQVADGSAQ